jgi:hypothetical protein
MPAPQTRSTKRRNAPQSKKKPPKKSGPSALPTEREAELGKIEAASGIVVPVKSRAAAPAIAFGYVPTGIGA